MTCHPVLLCRLVGIVLMGTLGVYFMACFVMFTIDAYRTIKRLRSK